MCGQFYLSNVDARKVDYAENTLFLSLQEILNNAFSGIARSSKDLFPGWKADRPESWLFDRIEPPHLLQHHFIITITSSDQFIGTILWQISRLVKTNNDSVICISGSTTSIKVTKVINDIDFCEYIRVKKPSVIDEISMKNKSWLNRMFRKLKFHKKSWTPPLDVDDVHEASRYVDATLETLFLREDRIL